MIEYPGKFNIQYIANSIFDKITVVLFPYLQTKNKLILSRIVQGTFQLVHY